MEGYPTAGETRHVDPSDMTGDEFTYVEHTDTGLTTEPFGHTDRIWYRPVDTQGE